MVDYSLVNVAEETSIGDLSILGLCGLSALANVSMEKTPYDDWSRLKAVHGRKAIILNNHADMGCSDFRQEASSIKLVLAVYWERRH